MTMLRILLASAIGYLLLGLTAYADERAHGAGVYLMGPGKPSVFTFDEDSMSCSVSWGTMGAPGPGPFSEPNMKLEQVNFGMVVFSLEVDGFNAADGRVKMTGRARSITTVDNNIAENAVYKFTVEAIDGGPAAKDSFSLTLHGANLMFDGHTFAPGSGSGVTSGDVVIQP
jgi:hypothetical protein